jgi:cation transport ATPase
LFSGDYLDDVSPVPPTDVFAPRGIVLNPAVGAVLMSASTVIVALNAQLLRVERL